MNPSPITTDHVGHVCLICTRLDRVGNVWTTDPISHVEECHPEAAGAVRAQFAPRYQKIRRTAV